MLGVRPAIAGQKGSYRRLETQLEISEATLVLCADFVQLHNRLEHCGKGRCVVSIHASISKANREKGVATVARTWIWHFIIVKETLPQGHPCEMLAAAPKTGVEGAANPILRCWGAGGFAHVLGIASHMFVPVFKFDKAKMASDATESTLLLLLLSLVILDDVFPGSKC